MRHIDPPEDIAHLLREFEGIGGVIEYVFFTPDAEETVDWQAHLLAILLAYERWDAEYRQRSRCNLHYTQNNKELPDDYPPAAIKEHGRLYTLAIERGFQACLDKLTGESVTPYQFLGRTFQLGYLPLPPGQKSGALRPNLMDMRDELKRLNAPVQPASTFDKGYAYAFSNPPYNLQADGDTRLQIFRGLNYAAFSDFAPDVGIYQWTTDWCGYFDAGNEWWGSFLWTVHNPARNFVVVIAASATD